MSFTSWMRARFLLRSATALVAGAAVWLAPGLGNAGAATAATPPPPGQANLPMEAGPDAPAAAVPAVPACPPLGYTLSTGQVVVSEQDFEGIGAIPLGRPFVVVRCHR